MIPSDGCTSLMSYNQSWRMLSEKENVTRRFPRKNDARLRLLLVRIPQRGGGGRSSSAVAYSSRRLRACLASVHRRTSYSLNLQGFSNLSSACQKGGAGQFPATVVTDFTSKQVRKQFRKADVQPGLCEGLGVYCHGVCTPTQGGGGGIWHDRSLNLKSGV